MTDKTVTRADLETLRRLRNKDEHLREWSRAEIDATDDLLDRLIAAAEADVPPLPEGWVLLRIGDGEHTALWHEDGMLWTTSAAKTLWSNRLPKYRDRLTPLRPTIAKADVEKAFDAFLAAAEGMSTKGSLRAAFAAAGVVIEP